MTGHTVPPPWDLAHAVAFTRRRRARGRRLARRRGARAGHRRWQRHVVEAAQGGHGRRASASIRARSTWPRSRPAATGSPAPRATSYSADYVALRARFAGLNVSRFDFNYDLFALGDWKPPVLDVRRGKRYIPGIAGSIPGGDFGSMVNSRLGRRHRAGVGRRPHDPVAGCELVGLRVSGRRLRRHAGGRDRAAPARHLRRPAEDAQRAGRGRRRDRLHQRGQRPAVPGQPHRPALVQHDRAPASTSRSSPRRSRPCRISRGGVAQGLVGKTAAPAGRVPRRQRSRRRT